MWHTYLVEYDYHGSGAIHGTHISAESEWHAASIFARDYNQNNEYSIRRIVLVR